MIDVLIRGKISINDSSSETFIKSLNQFFKDNNASFLGELNVIEFDEVEVIDD